MLRLSSTQYSRGIGFCWSNVPDGTAVMGGRDGMVWGSSTNDCVLGPVALEALVVEVLATEVLATAVPALEPLSLVLAWLVAGSAGDRSARAAVSPSQISRAQSRVHPLIKANRFMARRLDSKPKRS
jgi:hypothetical protein